MVSSLFTSMAKAQAGRIVDLTSNNLTLYNILKGRDEIPSFAQKKLKITT